LKLHEATVAASLLNSLIFQYKEQTFFHIVTLTLVYNINAWKIIPYVSGVSLTKRGDAVIVAAYAGTSPVLK